MISIAILVVAILGWIMTSAAVWFLYKQLGKLQTVLKEDMQGHRDVVATSIVAVSKAANEERIQRFQGQQQEFVEQLQIVHQHLDKVVEQIGGSIRAGVAPVLTKTEEVAKHMAMYSALIESQERLIEAVEHLALKSPIRRHE